MNRGRRVRKPEGEPRGICVPWRSQAGCAMENRAAQWRPIPMYGQTHPAADIETFKAELMHTPSPRIVWSFW